jgi:ATP-dependent Lon protease
MKLPLLITRDLITFPKFPLQFKIGRAQSIKTATAALNDHNGLVLITAQKDPNVDEIKLNNIYETAVVAKITSFDPNAQAPMMISVLGETRVKLVDFEEKDIIYAEYKGIVDKNNDSEDAKKIQKDLLNGIEDALGAFPGMSAQSMIAPFANAKPSEFADSFAFYLPLSVEEKYTLLGEEDVVKRLQLLQNKINELSGMAPVSNTTTGDPATQVSNEVNQKVNDKLQKQQREFMLREQLKQIEEELGEITGEENDINTLLDQVENNPYPKEVKAKLRKEIRRLKSTPSASAEYGIIRSYIDTVMEVP